MWYLVLMLVAFLISSTPIMADNERVTISGNTFVTRTATMLDAYSLTIDYSEVDNLSSLRLSYRVNDGEWQNINFRTDRTSHNLLLRSGMEGLSDEQTFHTIYVAAEDELGRIELEKRILAIDFANRDWECETTGVTVRTMRFPIGTEIEVEQITDPLILRKFPLLNMGNVYKVSATVDGVPAGQILRAAGIGYGSTTFITLVYPMNEENRQLQGVMGFVFHPDFTTHLTVNYMRGLNDGNMSFVTSTGIYVYEEGYAYYTIGTEIDPDHVYPPEEPEEDEESSNNLYLYLVIILLILIIGAIVVKKSFSKNIIQE